MEIYVRQIANEWVVKLVPPEGKQKERKEPRGSEAKQLWATFKKSNFIFNAFNEGSIDLHALFDWDILWPKLAQLDTLKAGSVTLIVTKLSQFYEKNF